MGGQLGDRTRDARFLRARLWDGEKGVLYRSVRERQPKVVAFAADHAALIGGLLDLYEAGFELEWLRWAMELQQRMDEHFLDQADGCYYTAKQNVGLGQEPLLRGLVIKPDF